MFSLCLLRTRCTRNFAFPVVAQRQLHKKAMKKKSKKIPKTSKDSKKVEGNDNTHANEDDLVDVEIKITDALRMLVDEEPPQKQQDVGS